MLRHFRFCFLLISLISCSQFQTQRSYLSEMEHDDSTFFAPKEDFPVVAGDTGRYWASEKERNQRTPHSEQDVAEDRAKLALKAELRTLEGNQSETAMEFYEKYRDKLQTTSERIYFLKLSNSDRRDYLETRGFMQSPSKNAYTANEKMFARRHSEILLGMKKNEVVGTWGKPTRVEIAGNPSYQNERWVYNMNGATKYIYFESGEVQGWE